MSITVTQTKRPDPLAQAPQPPDRVVYELGVLLDAQDFRAAELYHRGRLARALAYLHGSGTVAGLRVEWDKPLLPGAEDAFPAGRAEMLHVQPGLAVDRLGRLIEIPTPACLRLDRWYEQQGASELSEALHNGAVIVDVFVRFTICERGKTPAFASGPFDALNAVQPSRLREFYQLELVLRDEGDWEQRLPQDPWAAVTGATPAERLTQLQDAVLQAWHEGKDNPHDNWTKDGLHPLPEHAVGQDPTSLFLARLQIPAANPLAGQRPARLPGQDVQVANHLRSFVYAPNAIVKLANL